MPTLDLTWADLAPMLGAFLLGFALAGLWLRARSGNLQSENAKLQLDLARLQAAEQHLRERLAETAQELQGRDARLSEQAQVLRRLESQYIELQTRHAEKQAQTKTMQAVLDESRTALKLEFQNLANHILDEKGKAFAATSQSSLDGLLRPFREQIEAFQKRVNQIHDEALRGNVSLGAEIRRVADMGVQIGKEASSLATALRGEKKTAGNWGEVLLERSLQQAGLIRDEHYRAQPALADGGGNRRYPDFVVYLPDDKHLVLDSKVSLVDYDKAVAAATPEEQQQALDAHLRAVRNHIDDLSTKDYGNLPGLTSPSFVMMYMPIEAAYIEALKHSPDLYEYGWRKNVILVSHTTLLPILKTVANVWLTVRSNEQAHELSAQAGDVYNQVALIAERLKRLGGTLSTVSRHYNDAVTAVAGQQGLVGKVSRFAELSSKANKVLPQLDALHTDFHHERLGAVDGASEPNIS